MSKTAGKKRASPGAEGSKDASAIDLTDEQVKALHESQKEYDLVQLSSMLTELKKMDVLYAKRRQVVKQIPKFWPTAFFHNKFLELEAEHSADRDALSFLEDIWIERNQSEPRAFKIEMHFAENPYFSNKVLVKDYSYTAPPNQDSAVDEYGLTAAQRDFEEERDIKVLATAIEWKNDGKNLIKMYPRKMDVDDEDEVQDRGSFFNFFADEGDDFGTGSYIVDVYDEAIKYFFNQMDDLDDEDLTDSDSEAAEEGDEEIDLEQPRKKVRKA